MEDSSAADNALSNSNLPPPRLDQYPFCKPIALSLFAIALLSTICAIYWPARSYPFIQDDWGQLNALTHARAFTAISNALSIKGKLFYRPLGQFYFYLYYICFGLNPLPFHVIGLVIHALNSLLVSFISWKLTKNALFFCFSGLIYAAVVTIHLDPLLWLVGIYELSASFFAFAAIALTLANRKFLSAVAFGLGMLAKEPVAVLIFILPLILMNTSRPTTALPRFIRRTLWPHGLILIVYVLFRAGYAVSPFSLPDTHPYVMRIFGVHVFKNIFRYAWWGLEALTPMRGLTTGAAKWILLGTLTVVGILCFVSRRFFKIAFAPGTEPLEKSEPSRQLGGSKRELVLVDSSKLFYLRIKDGTVYEDDPGNAAGIWIER